MLRSIFFAGLALTLSACAAAGTTTQTAAAPADRDCFRNEDINGFRVVDENHVNVRVGARRNYVLTTDWNAQHLSWSHVLSVRSQTGWICTGSPADLRIVGSQPVRSYYITNVERGPDRGQESAAQGS
ncbi:hypothetical protein U91I_02089 [alpha proteobacterium U9-1i]|nr:hypothetical protein U91I_02089 [alpha proteobacterium U9-1i]